MKVLLIKDPMRKGFTGILHIHPRQQFIVCVPKLTTVSFEGDLEITNTQKKKHNRFYRFASTNDNLSDNFRKVGSVNLRYKDGRSVPITVFLSDLACKEGGKFESYTQAIPNETSYATTTTTTTYTPPKPSIKKVKLILKEACKGLEDGCKFYMDDKVPKTTTTVVYGNGYTSYMHGQAACSANSGAWTKGMGDFSSEE